MSEIGQSIPYEINGSRKGFLKVKPFSIKCCTSLTYLHFCCRNLTLRDDSASPHPPDAVLKNAKKVVDDYFVAPPGNIPLIPSKKD